MLWVLYANNNNVSPVWMGGKRKSEVYAVSGTPYWLPFDKMKEVYQVGIVYQDQVMVGK